MLNEHEIVQAKLRNLERLTNDHDKSEAQSDMIEDLIQVDTDGIILNENTSQSVTLEEINQMMKSSQNKILNPAEVETEQSPGSLRNLECILYLYM